MLVNRRDLRVEWGQCDPAGIVFYPQYLIWFDSCTAALFERTGLPLPALYKKYGGVGMPLVEVGARFVIPSRFGDLLVAESFVEEWGRSSFTVRHRFLKEDKLALEGFEKRVWVVPHPHEPDKIKAHRTPPEIVASLSDASGQTRCTS